MTEYRTADVTGVWEHNVRMGTHDTRMTCVLCCSRCERGEEECSTRRGQLIATRCSACQETLCTVPRAIWGGRTCWEVFHRRQILPSHPYEISDSSEIDLEDAAGELVEKTDSAKKRRRSVSSATGRYESPLTKKLRAMMITPETAKPYKPRMTGMGEKLTKALNAVRGRKEKKHGDSRQRRR